MGKRKRIMAYLTNEQIEKILDEVIKDYLIPHFVSKGMRASGNWESKVEAVGNVIRGPRYTEQLTYGRQPGTFAPIAPLKEWAKIKLGLNDRQATSAAYAISHKLKKEGNEYFKQGGTDLIEYLSSPQVIRFINTKAKGFVEAQVDLELRTYIRDAFN